MSTYNENFFIFSLHNPTTKKETIMCLCLNTTDPAFWSLKELRGLVYATSSTIVSMFCKIFQKQLVEEFTFGSFVELTGFKCLEPEIEAITDGVEDIVQEMLLNIEAHFAFAPTPLVL